MNYLKILEMKLRDNQQWQKELQEGIEELETVERFEVDAELQEMKRTEANIIKLYKKIEDFQSLLESLENDLRHETNLDIKATTREAIFKTNADLQKLYKEVK